ncbi:hypothetical protein TWF225_005084 [Orbilia oligospora]|nr:hypothetical protein TWF225_005084 [Orbilia oligospora]KAF3256846.1 hypothetical protein TWF217_006166 [Orbilia oligospora]
MRPHAKELEGYCIVREVSANRSALRTNDKYREYSPRLGLYKEITISGSRNALRTLNLHAIIDRSNEFEPMNERMNESSIIQL